MPQPHTISITPQSPGIAFEPSFLQVQPADQIMWANNDQQLAHWPGLCDENGNILNEYYFMRYQIAPNSPSTTFTPGENITLHYVCSLHPDEKGTVGTIQVGTGSTGQ
ncbi:MAG: hypothetical protein WA655_05175 [Candidatus Korobacteraceae bacterium]